MADSAKSSLDKRIEALSIDQLRSLAKTVMSCPPLSTDKYVAKWCEDNDMQRMPESMAKELYQKLGGDDMKLEELETLCSLMYRVSGHQNAEYLGKNDAHLPFERGVTEKIFVKLMTEKYSSCFGSCWYKICDKIDEKYFQ